MTPCFLFCFSYPKSYRGASKDLGYFLLLNFNKRTTSVSAKKTNGRWVSVVVMCVRGVGAANRLQMAAEFNNFGVEQRTEKDVDAQIRSMEWKLQKIQQKPSTACHILVLTITFYCTSKTFFLFPCNFNPSIQKERTTS